MPEMNGQNTSYCVLVDLHTKGQSNLLRNSWTSPGGIALFHLDDCIDEFSSGPFWTRLTAATGTTGEFSCTPAPSL
jgi:hypothetical protein